MIYIGILLLIVFMAVGMPIGAALGLAGFLGVGIVDGFELAGKFAMIQPFRDVASYSLMTMPLFVLMAELMDRAGFAKDAYVACYKCLGHKRGGLAIATIIGGAAFGACSGSSSASTATFGAIAIPEMKRYGYSDELSGGVVSVAGTLAAVIPPSILLVVYGSHAEVAIGRVLMAGVVPGIILAAFYAATVVVMVRLNPKHAPLVPPFPKEERRESLKKIWPIIVLAAIIMIFLYTGVATPTETAALGAIATLFIGVTQRVLGLKEIKDSLISSLRSNSMMFLTIIGAQMFTYYMTLTGITADMVGALEALHLPTALLLFLIIMVYIFLGMFLPPMGIMMLTLPLVLPLIDAMGYDRIWFGVVLVIILEMGLVTPPVGLNCFIASGVSGIPLMTVFKGGVPLLAGAAVAVFLFCAFPDIVMLVPNIMGAMT